MISAIPSNPLVERETTNNISYPNKSHNPTTHLVPKQKYFITNSTTDQPIYGSCPRDLKPRYDISGA